MLALRIFRTNLHAASVNRERKVLPKRISVLRFMKPVSRWKVKYPSVNLLSQPLSLIREKQPLIDVFDEKNQQ